jgi:plasmid stability protein
MKTSIDLPDDLYRRVKARSAMEGRTVREVATQLLSQWIDAPPTPVRAAAEAPRIPEADPVALAASSDWRYEWATLGARVARVLAEHRPHHPDAGTAEHEATGRHAGMVEQLERDRR